MDRSEKFWDKTAEKYSKSDIKDKEGYHKTLQKTRKFLKRDAAVLEIGCGTGTTALLLSGSVNAMTATDISSNMIAIAKKKAKDQRIGNVNFLQSTIFDEKLKEGSYDVILAYNLMHLLEDTQGAMKRINELLKPGGLFISKTPCLKEKSILWPMLVPIVAMALRIGCVKSFTIDGFKEAITSEGFAISDASVQYPKPPRLFVVARKN